MILRASLSLLLVCAALPAQVAEKPLTNADIGGMIAAGLPESTVILAIQRAVERGNTRFDPSATGLVGLKNAGASEAILNTILLAPNLTPYEPSTAVPGLPTPRGFYAQAGGAFRALDSVVLWGDVNTHFGSTWKNFWSWDRAREDRRYSVAGAQAAARLGAGRPTLYLRSEHPTRGGWMLVRMTSEIDHREILAHVPDLFAKQARMSFDSGSPVPLEVTSTAADVVSLRPTVDLAPGEWLLFRFVDSSPWLMEGYAFEVGTT